MLYSAHSNFMKTFMKYSIASLMLAGAPSLALAQRYMMYSPGSYDNYSIGWFPMILFAILPILWIGFCILMFVFWLCILIDAIKHAPEKMKLIWVVVIIFTNIIGALIYYFVEKRPRKVKTTERKEA